MRKTKAADPDVEGEPIVKEEKPKTVKFYKVRATFTEAMLGSSPASKEVYEKFIGQKLMDEKNEALGTAQEKGERIDEEMQTLPAEERDKMGRSVFHRDDQGIFLFDYQVRGFLKSAAQAVTGREEIPAYKSKIDMWCFVKPRRIHVYQPDGKVLKEPHGWLERPIRAMTMQGPRVSLKASEIVKEGCSIEFEICILPLGQKIFSAAVLPEWLEYGSWQGLGEWRNGSYGRFEFKFEEK